MKTKLRLLLLFFIAGIATAFTTVKTIPTMTAYSNPQVGQEFLVMTMTPGQSNFWRYGTNSTFYNLQTYPTNTATNTATATATNTP